MYTVSVTKMGEGGAENMSLVERRATNERNAACKATAHEARYAAIFLDTRCPLKYRYAIVATATRANDASILAFLREARDRMREMRSARAQ